MKQIIIVRHGESLEDINNEIYAEIADNDIPLTNRGCVQVLNSALVIEKIVRFENVKIFHGTAKRVSQSASLLHKNLRNKFDV